jgi:hypothetical protein
MTWFGSPRPGQSWPQARADQMFAAYGTAELQRSRARELTPGSLLGAPARPLARIERVWDDHNFEEHNQTGLRLHIEFIVNGMFERRGVVAAYFRQAHGDFLRDTDGRCLCVRAPFEPRFNAAHYKDFPLFMPYAKLPLGPGTHSLEWEVTIWAPKHKFQSQSELVALVRSELVEFDLEVW